jgi:hypothetical protein
MAIIYTYPEISDLQLDDLALVTDKSDNNNTKQTTISSIKDTIDVVDSLTAGAGISLSGSSLPTGDITIANTGVLSISSANAALTTSGSGAITLTSTAYSGGSNIGHVPTGGSVGQYLGGDGNWDTVPPDGDITGTGTSQSLALFSGAKIIADSALTQSGTLATTLVKQSIGRLASPGGSSTVVGLSVGDDSDTGFASLASGNLIVRSNGQEIININSTPSIDLKVLTTLDNGLRFTSSGTTLSSYETGTFSPTMLANGSPYTGGGSFSGIYEKIGNQVTCYIDMSFTSTGGTGSLSISGLPFTCNSTIDGGGSFSGLNAIGVTSRAVSIKIPVNTTLATLYYLATSNEMQPFSGSPAITAGDEFKAVLTYKSA